MIAVGGKDKGEGMKDKTVIVIRDRVRKRTPHVLRILKTSK